MTAVSEIADRYASALFDLADEKKALDVVADDLRAVLKAAEESEDFVRFTRSLTLSREKQKSAMQAIAKKGKFNELTANFLGVIAGNRRLFALSAIAKRFLEELASRRGEMTAEVTSARPLTDAQMKALSDILKKSMGAKVSLEVYNNPDIIGGLIVKVGSKLIDSSVRSKLERLERAMKAV